MPHYRSFGTDPSAATLLNVRDSRYTSNKVANIDDVEEIRFIRYAGTVNDLRIMHHRHGLKALVDLYDRTLQDLGFTRVESSSWRSGGDYLYRHGDGLVKLNFHREGDGVALRVRVHWRTHPGAMRSIGRAPADASDSQKRLFARKSSGARP